MFREKTMAAGYIILAKYEFLYRKAINEGTYNNNPFHKPIYGIPYKDYPEPPNHLPKYKGVDRESLTGLTYSDAKMLKKEFPNIPLNPTPAENLYGFIQNKHRIEHDCVPTVKEAKKVWRLLKEEKNNYEIIFAKEYLDTTPIPEQCSFLGCDVAYFSGDYFSCICDALFFPKWHGTDNGTAFQKYFNSLNENGLFQSNEEALAYLKYYLSFDWTERSDEFTSLEIYSVNIIRKSSLDD